MRVIIAGSRGFNDYDILKNYCDKILQLRVGIQIVSGGAKGADSLGERYAIERGYDIKPFLPNWDLYGKRAGYIRNEEMAKYASGYADRDQKLDYILDDKVPSGGLIAFWDHKSRGTKHMIDLAYKYNLKVRIHKV
jgi:hypothetical protein